MKPSPPTILVLLSLTVLSWAQALYTYRDQSGDLEVRANSGRYKREQGGKASMLVQGNPVVVVSRSQAFQLRAQRVTINLAPAPGNPRQTIVERAVAPGKVRFERNTIDRGVARRVELDGIDATYSSETERDRLVLERDVLLVVNDGEGKRVTTLRGQRTVAVFGVDKGRRDVRTVDTAGPVTVDVREQPTEPNRTPTNVRIRGNRLVLNYAESPATIIFTGNVSVEGEEGSAVGTLTGAHRAILTLNEKGELGDLEILGEPVVSNIRGPQQMGGQR